MASFHARSNSLPSRQHPLTSQIEENLNRLRSSQSASTSSSLGQSLNGVQDLHEYVDMLLQLPSTQQALAQEEQRKCVEELLDGSLVLLDVCNIAKDALFQIKECTQELQSILRRRRGVEGLASEVRKYLISRKAMKKAISKALKNLKHLENKQSTSSGEVTSILREVEAVTCGVLESLLSFVSGPTSESKLSRFNLVSKLMNQKKVASEEDEENTNEIANVEATLRSFVKSENNKHVENLQNELQSSESCIQDLEEGLECLFRCLIKARVTVLNALNC
ncbi:hypothetical protein COLO4_27790 [Corchorus olitorius]|uniref:Uncharacterized protein n=1 Tax=Corchorus olitorius TaxID=93759 RepID=A0A1R3HP79_9ROSI|nr:hypothetical protein COLO4_27790 [Corchorus olitorius]